MFPLEDLIVLQKLQHGTITLGFLPLPPPLEARCAAVEIQRLANRLASYEKQRLTGRPRWRGARAERWIA